MAARRKKVCSGWHLCGPRVFTRGQPTVTSRREASPTHTTHNATRRIGTWDNETGTAKEAQAGPPTTQSYRQIRGGRHLGRRREARGQGSIRARERLRAHNQALPGSDQDGGRTGAGTSCQGTAENRNRADSRPADRDVREGTPRPPGQAQGRRAQGPHQRRREAGGAHGDPKGGDVR